MNYTLYIDESGDFESERGQWVLAGVLFAESYLNCEKFLKSKLDKLPSELGLKSIKSFHLTEFRRDFGHDVAVDMAGHVLKRLNYLPFSYHCMATINQTKTSLSNREKTYRLMLSDLLALCEINVPEESIISNLDLIVASRTIDGELQTSISNIDTDVIKSLPLALEVDLATKGMVELMGKHIKVKMDYANNSWGLVCADFIANLNYHNRKVTEKKYLEELENAGKYSLFESFGGYEIRRANVAERDGDYVLALYRWLIIDFKEIDKVRSKNSIHRLFFKIFNNRGTSGYIISFEAVIERLWRNYNSADKYKDLSAILKIFESLFIEYINSQDNNYKGLLFRLRNLMLIVENHLANTSGGLTISGQQNLELMKLYSNPEYFQMILDFKIIEIEIYINSLDVQQALILADKYYQMIDNFKQVWKLMVDEESLEQFEYSRANVKAEMTLLRCNVLCMGLGTISAHDMATNKITHLQNILVNKADISRLLNYRAMHLLKQNDYKGSVNIYLGLYNDDMNIKFSSFDLLWFLRSINDALLSAVSVDMERIKVIVEAQINNIDIGKKGHPIDLILRELALLEFQRGNASKAKKYIAKSKNAFDQSDSAISIWLQEVINIHSDYIFGKMKEPGKYFELLKDNAFVKSIYKSDVNMPFLDKVRHFSPY